MYNSEKSNQMCQITIKNPESSHKKKKKIKENQVENDASDVEVLLL